MTSKLTRERLQEIAEDGFLKHGESKELARMALAAMDNEPVEPIWRATKYPVSRPVPGAKLIVWDETGKFVGYGSAVDTSESGVAIQMCDGRRFDSNHELRWQYALQPVPVVDNEPVGWTDEEELRDVNVAGIGYLFGIDREANKFADPRRQIMLYRHAQPALVPDKMIYQDGVLFVLNNDMSSIERGTVAMRAWNACRAAMLQGAENAEPRCGIQTTPALDSFKKNADVRCGNSPANDTNVVKRLAITLPDTSSKAFWSGTGKTETFHPVTYRRWVKEAIERYCAIARIDVEVK